MPVSQAYLDMVREFLAPLGAISVRRMFGGAGIYSGGVMFALVEDDVLYFKADDTTSVRYVDEGMTPFTFEGQTRMVETSYWRAPERVFDEPDEMLDLAREAITVAANAKKAKRSQPAGNGALNSKPAKRGERPSAAANPGTLSRAKSKPKTT